MGWGILAPHPLIFIKNMDTQQTVLIPSDVIIEAVLNESVPAGVAGYMPSQEIQMGAGTRVVVHSGVGNSGMDALE